MIKIWPVCAVTALSIVASMFFTAPALADGTAELTRLIGNKNDSASATMAEGPANSTIIRLTPDRTKVIRLDRDAASVIVTNPAHASVMLDSPRLLIVMPRQPGATSFTVLNAAGESILERDVIVTAAQQKYIRVRKMCGSQDPTCVSDSYYYCPDGCYQVQAVPPSDETATVPEVMNAAPVANSNDNSVSPEDRQAFDEFMQMRNQPTTAPPAIDTNSANGTEDEPAGDE